SSGLDRDLDQQGGAALGGAGDVQRATDCLDAVTEPGQPRPLVGVCATDPVVADRQPQGRVGRVEFDVQGGGARVLGGVGQRLRNRVVRRDLYLTRQPPCG